MFRSYLASVLKNSFFLLSLYNAFYYVKIRKSFGKK